MAITFISCVDSSEVCPRAVDKIVQECERAENLCEDVWLKNELWGGSWSDGWGARGLESGGKICKITGQSGGRKTIVTALNVHALRSYAGFLTPKKST